FVGKSLADANVGLIKGGFTLGKVHTVAGIDGKAAGSSGIVVRQFPLAGQRVAAGATISFDVKK
ncbi:MAG TPA: PASTA domain-containing protein, partial [Candidatus Angelobacter sp.]|nr:PASTA domain-containing protein [Candidatus Angelobacter sp.]